MRVTHTYALLEVSKAAYDEIRGKLVEAKYDHLIDAASPHQDEPEVISMHGIALVIEAEAPSELEDINGRLA